MIPARYKNSDKGWQWRLTFLGQRMGHNYYLYYLLDLVFQQNPQLRSVIEIGTGHGAMTTVLGLWGVKLGIPVMTIDCNDGLYDKKIFEHMGICFVKGDEFDAAIISSIRAHFWKPTFLICDGGNKPREFNMWAPQIPPGSVIAAHDWGAEITEQDVRHTVDLYSMEPFLPEKWDHLNVQFAMWRKP